MRGRLIDLSRGMNGKQRITFEIDTDFRDRADRLKEKELDIDVKQHREKRSKSANAYFHVLVNKIAAETGESDDAAKARLVVEYGVVDKDEKGVMAGCIVRHDVDVTKYCPYVRYVESKIVDGVAFNCYLFYKHTHEMDTKEMARLIDGAISEAQELGIETESPDEIAKRKALWEQEEKDIKHD